MTHDKQPKQPDMTNDFMYEGLRNKPGNFFYGVDQHLAIFVKLYVVLFFVFLLIVLRVLKDYFLPGLTDSQFFSFLFFSTGS